MDNMKYRIQITKLNNGESLYKPQVYIEKVETLYLGIKKIVSGWENIIMGIPSKPTSATSTTLSESWGTEEEALNVIKEHKEKIRIENGEQPSNVTYKMID